jgi:hypothetical protein
MPRLLASLCLGVLLAGPARAEFVGRFSVSAVRIPDLAEPDWGRRETETGVTYLCANLERCAFPTGIEVKGVLRSDPLPEAFRSGALSPARMVAQGRANAVARGSTFRLAEPYRIGALEGVHMEAEIKMGGPVHILTRWVGRGDRLLEVKVTSADLDAARRLSDLAMGSLVPQVFPGP